MVAPLAEPDGMDDEGLADESEQEMQLPEEPRVGLAVGSPDVLLLAEPFVVLPVAPAAPEAPVPDPPTPALPVPPLPAPAAHAGAATRTLAMAIAASFWITLMVTSLMRDHCVPRDVPWDAVSARLE